MPQISRQNHYVPKWYQKEFIRGSRGTLYRLDLDPPKRQLPNGRTLAGRDVQLRSPKRCFVEEDLYTTRFGQPLNDEVERFLFGPIDTTGALAVRAFVGNEPQATHNHFQSFFEYLDAQKLRTPTGLDWIYVRYPNLTQIDLMVEMQARSSDSGEDDWSLPHLRDSWTAPWRNSQSGWVGTSQCRSVVSP